MRWWERQIGGPMRGRIIALLRRGASTVEELAGQLKVTDNAVRTHLQLLEREGVVSATGSRQGPGAGKPADTYAIATQAEPSLSSAYAPVLSALLGTLAERMLPVRVDELLREVGRRLGPDQSRGGPLETRVRAAAALLSSLGSELDVERTPEGYLLRGHACPLAAVVRDEPDACHAVEELVAAVVGTPVRSAAIDRPARGAASRSSGQAPEGQRRRSVADRARHPHQRHAHAIGKRELDALVGGEPERPIERLSRQRRHQLHATKSRSRARREGTRRTASGPARDATTPDRRRTRGCERALVSGRAARPRRASTGRHRTASADDSTLQPRRAPPSRLDDVIGAVARPAANRRRT